MTIKPVNMVGQKFERLTVIRRSYLNDNFYHKKWLCRCECGKEKNITKGHLISGNTKSCGCLKKELKSLSLGLASMRRVIAQYKINAKKRKLEWNLTEKQVAKITKMNCYFCGATPNNVVNQKTSNGEYIYNGLDRIDNIKGYTIDNVVPCCKRCNMAKNDQTLQEFKDWIKKVSERML